MTAELLFRLIISVTLFSIFGVVADWCEEFAQQISDHSSSSTGNLVTLVNDDSESDAPADASVLTRSPKINVLARVEVIRCSNTKRDAKKALKIFE